MNVCECVLACILLLGCRRSNVPTPISVENSPPRQKKRFQALSSSSAERPMASGLERGSRSANRLNQADMSLDVPPEAAANAQTHSLIKEFTYEVQ